MGTTPHGSVMTGTSGAEGDVSLRGAGLVWFSVSVKDVAVQSLPWPRSSVIWCLIASSSSCPRPSFSSSPPPPPQPPHAVALHEQLHEVEQPRRRGGAGQAGTCSSPGDGGREDSSSSSSSTSSSSSSGGGGGSDCDGSYDSSSRGSGSGQVLSKGLRIRSLTREQVEKISAINGYVGSVMDPGVLVGARAEQGDDGGTMPADQLTAVQFLALAARSPITDKWQLKYAMQQRRNPEKKKQLKSAKGKGGGGGGGGGKGAFLWLLRPAHLGVWAEYGWTNHSCAPNAVNYVLGESMVVSGSEGRAALQGIRVGSPGTSGGYELILKSLVTSHATIKRLFPRHFTCATQRTPKLDHARPALGTLTVKPTRLGLLSQLCLLTPVSGLLRLHPAPHSQPTRPGRLSPHATGALHPPHPGRRRAVRHLPVR